jgi:outer membrane protein assembly factor BamB
VPGSQTTRCCSAVALIACCSIAFAAKPAPPLSLFPVRPVWTLPLNNLLTTLPAYDGPRAYFPIEGDRIAAYDLISGALQWIVSAKPTLPLTAGGAMLYYVAADTVTALRSSDGGIAWELPFTEPLATHLVYDNGWLVAATTGGSIIAFRALDGSTIWRHEVGSKANAPPALAADHLYVSTTDGRIVALDVADGGQVWERRLGGAPNEILALQDRLYAGSKDNFLYCLMAKDGRIDWRWRTGGDVIGTPVADEHRVYFVSVDNTLRALDRVNGGQRWMRSLPLRPTWGPVKAGGTLVVAFQAPSVRVFNLNDGVAAGEVAEGAEVAAPLYALDDPLTRLPMVLAITRDMANGAGATLVTRNIEPLISPIGPLPNPVTLAPTLPMDPESKQSTTR